jgi:hypothetical protein
VTGSSTSSSFQVGDSWASSRKTPAKSAATARLIVTEVTIEPRVLACAQQVEHAAWRERTRERMLSALDKFAQQ